MERTGKVIAHAQPVLRPVADAADPVGVIDIGSNSVRLVVYQGGRRNPLVLYNEKEICELGRAVSRDGRLDEAAMADTLALLARFRTLADQMKVSVVHAVATAAVREADNGTEFIRAAERTIACPVAILSGAEEARLAAVGVLSGMPQADGLVGDLGGGSLELVDVVAGHAGPGETAPVGTLRLLNSHASPKAAIASVDEALAGMTLPARGAGRGLYLVGGTWRALARIHMEQEDYPLHIIDHYTIDAVDAFEIARLVRGLSTASLRGMSSVSAGRVATIPYGALVLERLVAAVRPRKVVFSAHGLREGLVHASLPLQVTRDDALIASAAALASDHSRSVAYGQELFAWTDALFVAPGPRETELERRLREAACMLGDIGWRAHPDYRHLHAIDIIVQGNLADLDHAGRAFLALAVYSRHAARIKDPAAQVLTRLVEDQAVERARVLGAAMRLGYVLSAAMEGVVAYCPLSYSDHDLVLKVPSRLAGLVGGVLTRRLNGLADLLERSGRIEIA